LDCGRRCWPSKRLQIQFLEVPFRYDSLLDAADFHRLESDLPLLPATGELGALGLSNLAPFVHAHPLESRFPIRLLQCGSSRTGRSGVRDQQEFKTRRCLGVQRLVALAGWSSNDGWLGLLPSSGREVIRWRLDRHAGDARVASHLLNRRSLATSSNRLKAKYRLVRWWLPRLILSARYDTADCCSVRINQAERYTPETKPRCG
jgi:hypothetical protein